MFIYDNIIETWIEPTAISSTSSQSGLSGNYKLAKDQSTVLRLTFTSEHPFHSDVISKLIKSIKVTVQNGSFMNLDINNVGIIINKTNKTIDFNYTSTSINDHYIEIILKSPNAVGLGTTKFTFNTTVLASEVQP